MASAAELEAIDPDLAQSVRTRIGRAGWNVSRLLRVIAPYDSTEDTEAIFLGHQAGTRSAGKQHEPHTAFLPQDPEGEVIVIAGFL